MTVTSDTLYAVVWRSPRTGRLKSLPGMKLTDAKLMLYLIGTVYPDSQYRLMLSGSPHTYAVQKIDSRSGYRGSKALQTALKGQS